MEYRKASNKPQWNRGEEIKKIQDMAALILDGEEDLLEEYDEIVKRFAKATRGLTPAHEADPVMYRDLVEKWGEEPGKMLSTNDQMRYLNYFEMSRFMRGYWR